MRAFKYIFVVVLLVGLSAGLLGCNTTSGRVMTSSEFSGFCYQAGGRRISCDNISICDEYLPVFEQQFASQAKCREACLDVFKRQNARTPADSCWLIIPSEATDYCQRYCREAYPQ